MHIRKGNFEALLNILEYFLVVFAADKGDRETLCTETAGTTDTVKVGIGIGGQVVVDGKVDTFDIDTTPENVGGDTDTFVEFLELLVAFDTVVVSDDRLQQAE